MSKHGITTQFGHKATKAFGGNGYVVLHFAFPNGYTASVIPETLSATTSTSWQCSKMGRSPTPLPSLET